MQNLQSKSLLVLVIFLLFLDVFTGFAQQAVYYQFGTIGGLLEGQYDGTQTIKDVTKQGNFGIGTFNKLNGELVMWQGQVWQVLADTSRGAIRQSQAYDSIPYAIVCQFTPDTVFSLKNIVSIADFEAQIEHCIMQHGVPAAIQVEGLFQQIDTRSVAAQQKPYKRLSEAVKQQSLFSFKNTKGVLVGFYTPTALKEIAVAGYHLHYLSSSRTQGGHLLNCVGQNLRVSICYLHQFHVQFPINQTPILNASQTETQQIERR